MLLFLTSCHRRLKATLERMQHYLELLLLLKPLLCRIKACLLFLSSHCRLKATLERMQRFTESYLELLLKLLPPVAEKLGQALGVAPYAIQTFTEAEIRANVVFQVRRSCWTTARAAR
jgi:hypothetical protein